MTATTKRTEWERAYDRRQNFVFVPAEEVVRFVSRHLRKRVGLGAFEDMQPGISSARIFDAGCGIGRNLIFGASMGLEMYGLDLSQRAVEIARVWLAQQGVSDVEQRVVQGDLTQLPWQDASFDHALSDSALDSMTTALAQASVAEIARVLKARALFYCNLISGERTGREDYAGEEIVASFHEEGTVQSYYTLAKIDRLFNEHFAIEEVILVERRDVTHHQAGARWHLTLRKRN